MINTTFSYPTSIDWFGRQVFVYLQCTWINEQVQINYVFSLLYHKV